LSHYESPDYELIKKEDPFELRKYQSFYLVEYSNDTDPDIDKGFNTLFSYISSNNNENRKISMTVPVIEDVKHDKKKMAFVVPKEFGKNIPKPNNKHLSVIEFEEGFYAVILYSGRSNESLEQQKSKLLHQWIDKNHWDIQSNDKLAFYNAPFTPGIFRKNEIMIKVSIKSET
jgi:hypothetical protein